MKFKISVLYRRLFKMGLIFSFLAGCATAKQIEDKSGKWVGTWAAAPQLVEPGNMPPEPGLSMNTIRQIVRVSIGGNTIRIRFSNDFGANSLLLESVSISASLGGGSIDLNTRKFLTFNGKKSVSVPVRSEIYSDTLAFPLKQDSRLAIDVHYGETPPQLTGHPGSRTTSYILGGNQLDNPDFKGAVKTDHWYTITGIDVRGSEKTSAVAILGNSITDGRGSGVNRQNRWPDIFSQRLLENSSTSNVSVLNLGIGGNCVVKGGLGPAALERFDRDILSQSGVKWLIILEGINDIGGISKEEDAAQTVQSLIDAYSLMIGKAHAKGIKVYGATILPFARSFYDTPFRQQAWREVNEWIRTSGKFDAVIDFARLMESSEPGVIHPDMHDSDHLHPNQAGYRKMGEFVDLGLFENKH
ncbi:MAG: SGNH/GDSL hydrolase family protein [Prevotella sp.]|jgi:lysophospholipase L1-like esterase|nr:SGNH/GDSL hydrolase family protein [Prevotella sp.]